MTRPSLRRVKPTKKQAEEFQMQLSHNAKLSAKPQPDSCQSVSRELSCMCHLMSVFLFNVFLLTCNIMLTI